MKNTKLTFVCPCYNHENYVVNFLHSLLKQTNWNWKLEPVIIKRGAMIGANATILPGITIGENAIIGAGAIVTKDVPDNAKVIGCPAKEK